MKKYRVETVVGLFGVIGLVCVGYLTVNLGKVSLLGDDRYSLYARFSSVSGLKVGNTVEVHGIEVGRVERLVIDQEKQMALVEMKLRKDIKVYDDGSASVKTSGLIGDKFIQIEPGGGGELLKPGSTITETSAPLDIEELIGKYAFGDIKKDGKKEDK